MRGIIYKDYLIAFLPKNIISMLANIIVSIGIVIFFPNYYGLALTVALAIPVSGSALLQMTMEQDEQSNFDKMQLTFPMTKKHIVLSKYIGGLMTQSVFYLFSLVVTLYYYFTGVAEFIPALQLWILGIIVGLIFFGICYTGFYLLGNKKGSIMYMIFMVAAAIIYILSFFNFDVMSIVNVNHNILLMIGIILAVMTLIGSYILSVKIYTKRYS